MLNSANTVEIFTGKGDGTFNSGVSFAGTGPVALGVGDFNGDKKMDLAVANYTASSVTVLLKANGQAGSQIRMAKAHMPMFQQ